MAKYAHAKNLKIPLWKSRGKCVKDGRTERWTGEQD